MNIETVIRNAEQAVKPVFEKIDETAQINTEKVLKAFWDNNVSEAMLHGSTGYGNDDRGRDTLEAVVAQAFGAEDALVRHTFVSGTHTLCTAFFALLRPGDTLYSVSGYPYDTLLETIGVRGEKGKGSLADFGIRYRHTELNPDGSPNIDEIRNVLKTDPSIRLVFMQRSRGYAARRTLCPEHITQICDTVRECTDAPIMVDNCYGEFIRPQEPLSYGADIIAGSLIKNPGGGLAQTGGYIAGKKDLVELCSYRHTAVGIGKENGATLDQLSRMFQGFFMAPHTVAQALKTEVFAAKVFEDCGYNVSPLYSEERDDIIQQITLNSEEKMLAFCKGIQHASPIDSFVAPEAWEMPGYADRVVMAAGTFVQGSSIELSADGPLKPPYIVYMQGGLTYESGKAAIKKVLAELSQEK